MFSLSHYIFPLENKYFENFTKDNLSLRGITKNMLSKLMEINLFENIFYIKYLLIGIVREEEFLWK